MINPPKEESPPECNPKDDRTAYLAHLLKLLGHPLRLQILALLERTPELPAGAFHEAMRERQPTVSQHLNRMRSSGLLKTRKQGGQILYSLRQTQVLEVLNCARRWDLPVPPPRRR